MRVTNSMSVLKHTNAIQNNLQNLSKVNEKLSTMKNINKLSDDPYNAIKVLNMNNEISTTEKYEKNCNEATGWLDTTDSSLDTLGNLIKNIKETLVSAGNGAYSDDEMKSLSIKINETMKEIANVLNSTHGGKYIFGGSETGEQPVIIEEITDPKTGNSRVELKINPNIDQKKLDEGLNISIAQGIDIEYNVKLSDIIPEFGDLNDISSALAKRDEQSIKDLTTTHLGKIENIFEKMLSTRSTYGIKANTVESMQKKNEEDLVQIKETLSKTQDVDFTTAIMELKQAELVYTASIQTGSKLMQNSILNYL